ncbi:MAG: hypothetical protein JXR29_05760 [Methylothermaceae bacterium]|nr:hypothetical protein [Methylothermaceae bacterium]
MESKQKFIDSAKPGCLDNFLDALGNLINATCMMDEIAEQETLERYSSEEKKRRYAVTYTLPYTHRVVVGVEAENREEAIGKAEQAFDAGEIWDDTPEMPLLFDDFEEDDGPLEWEAESLTGTGFPNKDASVRYLRVRELGVEALRLLVSGKVEEAYAVAEKAAREGLV